MSVSSIFGNTPSASNPLSQIFAPVQPSATTSITPAADTDSTGSSPSSLTSAAASTSISDGAKLLHQLQQLAQSDPAEFKKVTADIATQLQTAAQQTGGSEGQALSRIAAKFQQAAQTGNLSSLQPKHHHGGHHASASAAYKGADSIISQTLATDLSSAAKSATA